MAEGTTQLAPEARPGGALLGALRGVGAVLMRLPRIVALALALLWAGWIHWLSSGEIPLEPPLLFGSFLTNLGHAPLFGLLALWIACALPRRDRPFTWPRMETAAAVFVVGVVAAYGAADELHQATVPSRSACWADALTDVTAAACVVWVARYVGSSAALERGLVARLGLGVLACISSALIATVFCGGTP